MLTNNVYGRDNMNFFYEAGRIISEYSLFFIAYFAIINITAFIMYGADKAKAKKGKWRIPEATLIGLAGLGGGIGALLGMQIFRHKTKHIQFIILIPLFLILYIAFFCSVLLLI